VISEICNKVFNQAINDYHVHDQIDFEVQNPYPKGGIEHLLYIKNWIDTAQWHMEDVVRNPNIDPVEGLKWKRRIDAQNQVRTDMVEYIDSFFLEKYKEINPASEAKLNTESPAWAIDRLSILALKIYHMQDETNRTSASEIHRESSKQKLAILLQQRTDLSTSIDEFLADIESGKKYMKVYKQMKMYNDPDLNPALYNATS
jgi:hypothetical protein